MNKTRVFIAACAGMGFFGVTMLSLGPILTQLDAAVPGATDLPATMSIGIILGTLLFGPVVDRSGFKWLLIASAAMALAGVKGLSVFDSLPLLHLSIFLLGFGGGILNGLTNALVSEIYEDPQRGSRLGILGAFYCIGALLWTLLNYFIADYHMPLDMVSIVMLAFIVYFCFTAFPKPAAKEKQETSWKHLLGLAVQPMLLGFAVILFFQSGFEGVSGSFSVSFLCKTHEIAQNAATLSLTWFTIGMLAGRLPLGAIMQRLKKMGTLYLYLSVALVGVAIFTFVDNVTATYLAMVLVGFGVGATYPVVIDYIAGTYSHCAGTALSIAMFIGLLGQLTFNKSIGTAFASKAFDSLPIALFFALVAMMALLPLAVRLSSKKQN